MNLQLLSERNHGACSNVGMLYSMVTHFLRELEASDPQSPPIYIHIVSV